jgi:hypothetical protein
MSDILLNNGDISTTEFGDITVVNSYDEIAQTAVNNILLIYGEYEPHNDMGNKAYARRLKISDSSLDTIRYDCIEAISDDTRISEVVSMSITRSDVPENVNVYFVLKTIDGTTISNNLKITI